MIFYIIAHLLKLNFFSEWTTVNKLSFTIIIGTFLWSVLWQFTRNYIGNSIIINSIYTGFYYLVIADLYTFFMSSTTMYNNNIYNKNFHDINYYNTLQMQPIRSNITKTTTLSSVQDEPPINTPEYEHSDISDDIVDDNQDKSEKKEEQNNNE